MGSTHSSQAQHSNKNAATARRPHTGGVTRGTATTALVAPCLSPAPSIPLSPSSAAAPTTTTTKPAAAPAPGTARQPGAAALPAGHQLWLCIRQRRVCAARSVPAQCPSRLRPHAGLHICSQRPDCLAPAGEERLRGPLMEAARVMLVNERSCVNTNSHPLLTCLCMLCCVHNRTCSATRLTTPSCACWAPTW